MKAIILLLLIGSFGCSTTEKLVYIEPKPFIFQDLPQPSTQAIRVHNDDAELYEAYIDKLREVIEFGNSQIRDYRDSFSAN